MKYLMRRPRRAVVLALLALAGTTVFALTASSASLPGSNFEIDDPAGATTGANLTDDSPAGIDWIGVNETRRTDLPTGGGDDSYAGGEKEDDVCPKTGDGSIPNNKSDLLAFGAYQEAGPTANHPGFLNVFWSRVNAPTGTTNMDFEFNKSTTDCDGDAGGAKSSKNVTRTVGDILLQFDVDQGGKVAQLSKRTWTGTAWSDPPVDLDAAGGAIGAINQQPILAANSDGLITDPPTPALTARTFGEASFDLSRVFDPTKCESFGSAMLKSRSSDAFNSALKDFIAPIPLNIQNCGTVIIRKVTDPAGDPQSFGYTKAFTTDPTSGNTFSLTGEAANDDKTFNNVIFGTGLTVVEDALPAGWAFVSLNCDASTNIPAGERVITPADRKVTFTLNSATDILDCTYTNRKLLGAIEVTKTRKHADPAGSDNHAGVTFSIDGTTKTGVTDANGKVCFDGLTFAPAGTSYNVTETVPAGYVADAATTKAVTVNNAATCAATPYAGETVAFANTPLTNLTIGIDSQVPGGTDSQVVCTNGGPNFDTPVSGDQSVTVADLTPKMGTGNTIVCTITIDP